MFTAIFKLLLFMCSLIFFVTMLVSNLDLIIDDSNSIIKSIFAGIVGTIGYIGLFLICRKR